MIPRLLVVEDDALHCGLLGKIADKAGFTTTTAASFDDAVELLREYDYDCIILDLSLGPHTGVEVLHILSATACRSSIIIVSGFDTTTSEETLRVGHSLNLKLCNLIS